MMASLPTSIYITHLEREGPCIKVWGQTDRSLPVAIEKALQQMTPQFEQGLYSPAIENFQVGIMCCAKFKDEQYYRARITNISYLTQGMVEVLFVDYGNRDVINCMNTRTMTGLQTGLISIPAQAKDFILANVTLRNWDMSNFEMICSELRYLEFQLVPVLEVGPYILISLYSNKQDVVESLIERGFLLNIPIQIQQMTLQPLIARTTPPGLPVPTQLSMPVAPMPQKIAVTQPVPTPAPTLLTYKALPLDNESEHQIYISYVSDGPCLFSVQLKKMEEQLKRLMTEINGMDLQPLEEYPLPGTVCLAQSSEDGYICRAVVTSMVDGQYKVFYVDFGNTEVLPFDKLFQIPFKYVIPKVMATRFALAGLENATVSIEMKCKFKEFVNNRPLFMRVKPAATKSALPLCDLWDENNIKAIEMIKQAALLSYPEPAPLTRGLNQEVRVSFVFSCNRIFVQLKSKENELKQLMDNLQEACETRPLFNTNELKIGVPCCALFPDDGLWYRGEILHSDGETFGIRYVDFGNEYVVSFDDIRLPLPEHVTALRPQAIECCLNGYQNIEPDEQRDILLEELIYESDLNMRVVEVQGSRVLVDLFDKNHYNVASLLLEKIANASSMVSPLLIQDNHRIEQRKRSPPETYQKEFRDKKPLREQNDRSRDKQENWRQNRSTRNDEKSKAIEPYKHNLFQRRNIRNSEDSSYNESFQSERPEKFHRTSSRNNDSEYDTNENPENKKSFHHGNKRFDDQRGRHFSPKDSFEQTSNNDDDDWNNAENRNSFSRGKRNDFKMRGGGFDKRDSFEKRDGFERRGGFEKRDGFEQRDGFEKRDGFQKRDGFGKRDGFDKGDGFGRKDGFDKRDGFKKFDRNQSGNRKFDDNRPSRNFNDNRNDNEGFAKPKSRDYKRDKDGSEKSWSDTSERSWKKESKSFDKSKSNHFGGNRKGSSQANNVVQNTETWDTESPNANEKANASAPTYDYATEADKFQNYFDLAGTSETVSISWFYNPLNFYCQLGKYKREFREMMEEIQTAYRNRPTGSAVTGQAAIVPFSEDGVLYRAEIISSQFNQYHVKYVDYGNVATVNKVYPIEKRFMKIPAQGIPCGLQGITSYSENWPNPDTFSSYFDNDSFKCQFCVLLQDRYSVELDQNGKNVANLLTEASLAISIQPTDIDTSLLATQQMVVILRNVNSLSDIIVEIEPGVTLNVSMHNLATATETNEDSLKQWIGHFVIMYVDAVLENSLEITLYDLTGQKLQIITPDEGAYDEVDPICPPPIFSSKLKGWVSYASEESIYIQPSKFADTINQLLEALFQHYGALEQGEPITPTPGDSYAVLSSDTNWYRGNVTEVNDDEVIVTFVDYGNSESVPVTSLRELSPQFYQPHILAVEVNIPGDKEQYLEQEITVSLTPGTMGWDGKVEAVDDAVAETESPQLEETNEVPREQIPIETAVMEHEEEPVLPAQPSPTPQVGVSVIISHIDSPSEFYVQLSEATESINLLQEQLQEQVPSLNDLENPTAGVLCAAPYDVRHQWYRAQVLDADDDITTVRFVDFGNTDVLNNSEVHVKTLPTELLSIEFHAKLCSLFAKPIGDEWSSAALEKFEAYTKVENLSVEIIHQDEKTTYIELYAGGKNVGEMLKQEGLAADLDLETESGSTGFISHLNSPSEFWIQLESSCPDLEWVADQLANAESYPALEDLTPGSLCAAIFPGDDSWYRARILSNTVAGLEVIFIDYGNSCSCSGLRELPEDLIMLPPLALKCSLQKPPGVLQWSQSATEKFKEISADGATIFDVNVLTAGETSIVQLTYDGQDASMQLIPEMRQCFITHVDSLDSFWTQFMDDNVKIDTMTTEMEMAESWDDVTDAPKDSLVAALYEDGAWYRARVTEKTDEGFEVFLIDYGNTATVCDLKLLPQELATVEPLATKYQLEVLPRTKWGENSIELFRNLTECGAAVFDIEVVSGDTVHLYLNGIDVRSSLDYVKCTPSVSLQSSPKKQPSEHVQPIIYEDQDIVETETTNVDESKNSRETTDLNSKWISQDLQSSLVDLVTERSEKTDTYLDEVVPKTSDLIDETNGTSSNVQVIEDNSLKEPVIDKNNGEDDKVLPKMVDPIISEETNKPITASADVKQVTENNLKQSVVKEESDISDVLPRTISLENVSEQTNEVIDTKKIIKSDLDELIEKAVDYSEIKENEKTNEVVSNENVEMQSDSIKNDMQSAGETLKDCLKSNKNTSDVEKNNDVTLLEPTSEKAPSMLADDKDKPDRKETIKLIETSEPCDISNQIALSESENVNSKTSEKVSATKEEHLIGDNSVAVAGDLGHSPKKDEKVESIPSDTKQEI